MKTSTLHSEQETQLSL